MMQDYVRTGTYQRAILQNHTDFKDKVINRDEELLKALKFDPLCTELLLSTFLLSEACVAPLKLLLLL